MMKYFWILLLLLPVIGFADTKKISGTTNIDDSQFYKNLPDRNYGIDNSMRVEGPTSNAHTIIRVKNVAFELGENATITACVCSLYTQVLYYGNDNISAYQVFKPWVEGTQLNAECDAPGVTWNDWSCLDYEWTTAGVGCAGDGGSDNSCDGGACDDDCRDRKSTSESIVSVTTDYTWYGWSISTELAQGWYDGTIGENGIILIGSVADEVTYFYTSEYTVDPSLCPFFVFTYTTDGGTKLRQVELRGVKIQ